MPNAKARPRRLMAPAGASCWASLHHLFFEQEHLDILVTLRKTRSCPLETS